MDFCAIHAAVSCCLISVTGAIFDVWSGVGWMGGIQVGMGGMQYVYIDVVDWA